jgi:hypothetical protein
LRSPTAAAQPEASVMAIKLKFSRTHYQPSRYHCALPKFF